MRFSYAAELTALLLISASPVLAQPAVTGFLPTRNARSAPRATNVALTFSQAVSAASAANVRVFSAQRGGQLNRAGGGVLSGGGTATLTFDPAQDFRPGEVISVTVPATVQSTGGQPAAPTVYQFRTATGGTGTGTLTNPLDLPIGTITASGLPYDITTGDIDGDHDADILVAIPSDDELLLWRNNGNGTFAPAQHLAMSSRPGAFVLGDFNGDGHLDIAIESGLQFELLINNGTGSSWRRASATGLLGPLTMIVAGDVNGDGHLDLLTTSAGQGSQPGYFAVMKNDGNEQFDAPIEITVGVDPMSLAVGDIDADGDLDAVVANFNDDDVSIVRNNGTGTFTVGAATVPVGISPNGVALGDIDADGDLDFVTADATGSTASIRRNDGTGAFSGTGSVSGGDTPERVLLGDLDHDGDLDLLLSSFAFTASGSTDAVVRLNNGSGQFSSAGQTAIPGPAFGATMTDIDGDLDLDLITCNHSGPQSTVSIRYNGGTGPTSTTAEMAPAALGVYPSPAPATAPIRLTGAEARQPVEVLDGLGRRVAALLTDADGAATLQPGTLRPGLHVVRCGAATRRLVVE